MKNDYYFINSHENTDSIINELKISDELCYTIKSNFVLYMNMKDIDTFIRKENQ